MQRPCSGAEPCTPEEQRAACVAGIYDEKVAGRREKALGLVSWVFAYVKEHL